MTRFVLLSAAAAYFFVDSASAYPIDPVPLWSLVAQADAIVVAEVGSLGSDQRVSLRVLETWKGKTPLTFSMGAGLGLSCPATARYEPGRTVLAFLEREGEAFETVGMSYGSLYPDDAGILVFRDRVSEAIRIQSRFFASGAEKRAWAVRVASNRATRWHGLYELDPESDELHSYYDRSGRAKARVELTHDEAKAIADGFIAAPSVDHTLVMALSLLRDYRDTQLDEVMVAAADSVFSGEQLPYWALELLPLAMTRDGYATAKGIANLDDCESHDRDAKIKAHWREARDGGRHRTLPAIIIDATSVGGVGGETPD